MGKGCLKFFLACSVFFISFLILTVPYKDWRFFDDDYGAVHIGSVKSVSELKTFFSSNPNDRSILPSNMRDDTQWSFFGVMYRPFCLIMYAIEVALFGLNSHVYFLVSMALHALCGAVLFYIFSLFIPLAYAFFGAFCFVFYPIMGEFVGRFVMQTYSIVLLCLMGSFLFLKKFLDQRKAVGWYFASIMFFLIALFVHEIAIFYPLLLLLIVLPLYSNAAKCAVWDGIVLSIPYWIVVAVNLSARAFAYPLTTQSEYMVFRPVDFIFRFKIRFFDFVTFVVDSLGLTQIPGGNRLRKGLVLLLILSLILWVFAHCKRKRTMVLLTVGFLFFAWPSILITHQARYLYCGIPFLIAAMGVGLSSIHLSNGVLNKWLYRMVHFMAFVLLGSGVIYGAMSTKAREQRYIAVDNAYREVAGNKKLADKSLCFVGVPQEWFPHPGAAQAIWIYRGSDEKPVYHDPQMNFRCLELHSPLDEAKIPRGSFVDVRVRGNEVYLRSDDPKKAWVWTQDPFGKEFACTMGQRTVLQGKDDRAYEVSIKIDDKWMRSDLVFVTWDFEKQKLKAVGTR